MTSDAGPIESRIAALRSELTQLESTLAPSETLDEWSLRWFVFRGTRRIERERRTYAAEISPILGSIPVSRLSRSDVEGWVEQLDRRIADGELRWSTAVRHWTLLRSMLGDVSRSKKRSLRVRDQSLVADVRGPDHGHDRSGTFLYPSEFLQLVGCPRVPLPARRLYAVAAYLAARTGELAALDWSDIDLASGRIHIHRSFDRDAGTVGPTKTGTDRLFVADRHVLPLLRSMLRRSKLELVLPELAGRHMLGVRLRDHLETAGCDRADLYADDEQRRPLTFHDLRATGITWMAMRGDHLAEIMERVGHAQITTTQRYLRRGAVLASAIGEKVFPVLPRDLAR